MTSSAHRKSKAFINHYQSYLSTTLFQHTLSDQDPSLTLFKASIIYRRLIDITQFFESQCHAHNTDSELIFRLLQSALSQLVSMVNIAIHQRINSITSAALFARCNASVAPGTE